MKKGFTLIELLVVVLIIGILSSIALPQYKIAVEKARLAEVLTHMGNLHAAMDMYLLSNGYPSGTTELVGKSEGSTAGFLDIDVEAALDCSAGDDRCYSKHYNYDAYCYSSGCTISVYQNNDDYELSSSKSKSTGKWTNHCSNESDCSTLGANICKNLATQGWEVGICE